jgi:hypothetical protein
MKNPKSLSLFETTVVRGKWFEVNNLNHSAMDAPVWRLPNITGRESHMVLLCALIQDQTTSTFQKLYGIYRKAWHVLTIIFIIITSIGKAVLTVGTLN